MNDLILTKNRQVKHCPPHFTKTTIFPAKKERDFSLSPLSNPAGGPEAEIRDWLHRNISGRFFIGTHCELDKNYFVDATIAAFEDPKDATYFTLVLPSLLD